MSSQITSLLALGAGAILGLMLFLNGYLAKYIHPIHASFVIHITGLMTSLLILFFKRKPFIKLFSQGNLHWSYCVGFFGAIAVGLLGFTTNSEIGVAGTVGAVVLGQLIYSWVSDSFGLLGSIKRKLSFIDVVQAFLILSGVMVIVYG